MKRRQVIEMMVGLCDVLDVDIDRKAMIAVGSINGELTSLVSVGGTVTRFCFETEAEQAFCLETIDLRPGAAVAQIESVGGAIEIRVTAHPLTKAPAMQKLVDGCRRAVQPIRRILLRS